VPVPLLISNPNGIITLVGGNFPLLSPATALISGTGRRPEHATHPSREAAYGGGGRARKTHGIGKKKRNKKISGGFREERKEGNGEEEEGLWWVEECCVDVFCECGEGAVKRVQGKGFDCVERMQVEKTTKRVEEITEMPLRLKV